MIVYEYRELGVDILPMFYNHDLIMKALQRAFELGYELRESELKNNG